MIVFYSLLVCTLFSFPSLTLCMEKDRRELMLISALPSEAIRAISSHLIANDTQDLKIRIQEEQINSNQTSKEEALLIKLHEGYYNFCPSMLNFFKAFPEVINPLREFDPFFIFRIRQHFFKEIQLCPSGDFIKNFLTPLEGKKVHQERLYQAFYCLIVCPKFKFCGNWQEIDSLMKYVPLGTHTFLVHQYKEYEKSKLNFLRSEPVHITIAAILYNPFVDFMTRLNHLTQYLEALTKETKLPQTQLGNQAALKEDLKQCQTKTEQLSCVIDYILTSEENEKTVLWRKKGEHTLLYYYLRWRLYASTKTQDSASGFLNQEIIEALKIKIGKEVLSNLNSHLFSPKPNDIKKSAILKTLFQAYSVPELLTIFGYVEKYLDAIESYTKEFDPANKEIFYGQHFNNFITKIKEFDTVHKQDFSKFIEFLESELKQKFYSH